MAEVEMFGRILKTETPRKRAGSLGRWLFFTDGMGSGVRATTGNQAGVNLLILGFILLYFIQKGGRALETTDARERAMQSLPGVQHHGTGCLLSAVSTVVL